MDWTRERDDWPNAEASRFVESRPHRWHVQEAGSGPTLLLIHGAGGATQSWRDVFPRLAERYHVVAIDLPGQGFTRLGRRQRCGLDTMSEDVARLMDQEGWRPAAIIGHSAGAAIALRLAELLPPPAPRVVGLNAALENFDGIAGWLFPMMARLLALNPLTPWMFSTLSGTERRVRELLSSTGSTIDARGLALYRRLVGDRAHVDGTLAMMAQWNLEGLVARLPALQARTLFIVGEKDRAVSPDVSRDAAAKMPHARVVSFPQLGHLAHEEEPDAIVGEIARFLEND